jgi:hypothetical protein
VPLAGIEPALLAEIDFESIASTSSAIGAAGFSSQKWPQAQLVCRSFRQFSFAVLVGPVPFGSLCRRLCRLAGLFGGCFHVFRAKSDMHGRLCVQAVGAANSRSVVRSSSRQAQEPLPSWRITQFADRLVTLGSHGDVCFF